MKIFLILLKNCENLIAFLAFWEAILHKPLMMRKFQYFVLSSILLGLQKIEKLQVYNPFCFFISTICHFFVLVFFFHLVTLSCFVNNPVIITVSCGGNLVALGLLFFRNLCHCTPCTINARSQILLRFGPMLCGDYLTNSNPAVFKDSTS